MKLKLYILITTTLFLFISCNKKNNRKIVVNNKEALKQAIKKAEPGDHIILKNGIWSDVSIKFKANGTKENTIILKAETPGNVFIEGKSNLTIGGQYLQVKDLYFRNGHTPTNSVIRFKTDNETPAFNCSVTNCVIEEFTQPSRDIKDHWIELWGQHNTVANNYIAGKSNQGPTLRVFLKGNEHINNQHQIINNHFGPRPRKGGPKSETMQIGDSYTSMTPSYINVSNNYFERCNGEVEIISSKSNFNVFKNNIFFECEGSLVLRHGNYATINGNVFIGNINSEFIGGIRVINTGHWVTNNYFINLKGKEFRAPLAIMNGIPKSPLNRYNQVTDVVIAYNSFINTQTPFHIGVGANISQAEVLPPSEIRSAIPERTIIANNLIHNQNTTHNVVKNYDKIEGIQFFNNSTNTQYQKELIKNGITSEDINLKQHDTLIFYPDNYNKDLYNGFNFNKITTDIFGNKRSLDNNNIGAIVKADQTTSFSNFNYGTTWYQPNQNKYNSKNHLVNTNEELLKAIDISKNGDTILLNANIFNINKSIAVDKNLILKAKTTEQVTINFTSSNSAFEMHPKGKLKIHNIEIVGNKQQDAFKTLDKNMSKAYDIFLNNVSVKNFKSVLETSKGSFADTISIINSKISHCKKGLLLNKETNDKGDYNVEFLIVKNTHFDSVSEKIIDYYRGGYDESTIGGNLYFIGNTVTNCGKQEKDNILIKNRGIVQVFLHNNTFINNPVKTIAVLWGEKNDTPKNNSINNSGEIKIVQNLKLKLVY
ncbi:chondroitinase-B domain-containing protein [Tenacibaculum geojense]|uniref:Chondroitinase-B domain-containing protein n=1 Tax=Tenacibaculum geojense TaxID=915352 RepID=A0ABW3JU76_9FLAO